MNRTIAARILAPAAALVVGLAALAAAQMGAATGSTVAATNWVNHPAAIPAVSTPRNPGVATCDTKGLSVHLERRGLIGFGVYAYVYSAENTTSQACYVSGSPSVTLAGKTLTSGPNVLGVTAGVLAPGASASFAVTQSPRAECTPEVTQSGVLRTSSETPRVEIGVQSTAASSEGTILTSNCSTTEVSQIGVSQTAPKPDSLSALTIGLQAPASVPAGHTLQFAVTITNPTNTAIRLSPCPSYEVGISSARVVAYQLNCSSPVISPHQYRVYDMEYTVPANTPAGITKIGWFLLNATRTGAGSFITITT
jgi:hypothetical protein